MKILVCGGRHFNNYSVLNWVMTNVIAVADTDDVEIVSGHCVGADQLGERYAQENNMAVKIFSPNWTAYGRAAGPIRNKQMVDYVSQDKNSLVVAFVSPNSKGTKGTIAMAKKANIPVIEIPYEIQDLPIELQEGVRFESDGSLTVDWESDSPQDIVKLQSTCIKLTKFQKNLRYYEYKINPAADTEDKKKFLQYIKQNANTELVKELIERCAEDFYTQSQSKHYDYIIKLPSRSSLNDLLVDCISSSFDDCQIITAQKKPIQELDIDWELLKQSFKGDYFDQLKDYLTKLVQQLKKDSVFSISKVSPRYRRYIKPMISLGEDTIKPNTDILIIDDTFTTGSTIQMLLKTLQQLNVQGNISILTLVNNR